RICSRVNPVARRKSRLTDTCMKLRPESVAKCQIQSISAHPNAAILSQMLTVFLSYRHENSSHRDRVVDFARQLRKEGRDAGVRVILDELANTEEFHRGGPPEGWGRWSITQADSADRVLILASAGWFRSFRRQEEAGVGMGAAAEAGVIQQRLYEGGGKN